MLLSKWTQAYVTGIGTYIAAECPGVDWLSFWPKCEKYLNTGNAVCVSIASTLVVLTKTLELTT